ncbi:MAG: hypothetical protein FIB06_10925 [Betaproteobacteria bacterium]|nr:hypothetical protein [Betaproteobacteria bacterium]
MRRQLAALAISASALLALPAIAQVSVSIGQPGFYGRIDIGGFPAPMLIYDDPVIIRPGAIRYEPVYLRVPPGHAKDWHRYCGQYGACARPVYFVRDDWYRNEYAPRYRERHGYRDDDRDRHYKDSKEYRQKHYDYHDHKHGGGKGNKRDRD